MKEFFALKKNLGGIVNNKSLHQWVNSGMAGIYITYTFRRAIYFTIPPLNPLMTLRDVDQGNTREKKKGKRKEIGKKKKRTKYVRN